MLFDMKMQIWALNMYNLGTCIDLLHVSAIIKVIVGATWTHRSGSATALGGLNAKYSWYFYSGLPCWCFF